MQPAKNHTSKLSSKLLLIVSCAMFFNFNNDIHREVLNSGITQVVMGNLCLLF